MSGTLRDLFDLPRDAGKTTFVVKLTDAVTHPELLLRDYAVTPGIAGALDHALDLVRLAVRDRTSSATYVHGSFGSGKSHFMAVVSLLLANHPAAWSVPEVHPLRPKHEWVASTKLLRLHPEASPHFFRLEFSAFDPRPAPGKARATLAKPCRRRAPEPVVGVTFRQPCDGRASRGLPAPFQAPGERTR